MQIAIASGKGGTGKTFLAANLAVVLAEDVDQTVTYLDCDVEEPNGHLFLKAERTSTEDIVIKAPAGIDKEKCSRCGRCAQTCMYNALAVVNEQVLLFRELCHVCGACELVCPEGAIIEGERSIGQLVTGQGRVDIYYASLKSGEGGMSPRLVQQVKQHAGKGVNILDSPPGTSCPVVETIRGVDLCLLVTDPTPFGLHDLKLAVNMCRTLGLEPTVVVNRADYRDNALKDYCKDRKLDIIGEIPNDSRIAYAYSEGKLVVDEFAHYRKQFLALAERILARAAAPCAVGQPDKPPGPKSPEDSDDSTATIAPRDQPEQAKSHRDVPELVIISGKGGTGKTSLTAAFAALAGDTVAADCDVDAADLHLLLHPSVDASGSYSGGWRATIDTTVCVQCGACWQACRFKAIARQEQDGRSIFSIDPLACEGCGVCKLVCPCGAVSLKEAVNGQWFISTIVYGAMAHAELGIAEENSGRLGTFTRQNAEALSAERTSRETLIDGSPGTGCPVIASLTAANYALVVTEPTVSGLHGLKRILDLVAFLRIPAGIVVNKWDINPEMTASIESYCQAAHAAVLGRLPYDERITRAQIAGQTIIEYAPDSALAAAIRAVWERIAERHRQPSDIT